MLRVLLLSDGPVTVAEVVAHVSEVDGFDLGAGRTTTPSQRIASILRWQVRRRTALRVGRSSYTIDRAALPNTSRWRILHWDRLDGDGRLIR